MHRSWDLSIFRVLTQSELPEHHCALSFSPVSSWSKDTFAEETTNLSRCEVYQDAISSVTGVHLSHPGTWMNHRYKGQRMEGGAGWAEATDPASKYLPVNVDKRRGFSEWDRSFLWHGMRGKNVTELVSPIYEILTLLREFDVSGLCECAICSLRASAFRLRDDLPLVFICAEGKVLILVAEWTVQTIQLKALEDFARVSMLGSKEPGITKGEPRGVRTTATYATNNRYIHACAMEYRYTFVYVIRECRYAARCAKCDVDVNGDLAGV